MKKIALFLFLLSSGALAQTVEHLFVTLEIKADGSLLATEEIAVHFDLPRHGIIRNIPIAYRLPTGERYRLRLNLLKVLQNGEPASYRTYYEGGNFLVKIGHPDVTVQGLVAYTLHYRVWRALARYGDEVELYWNAIGDEWLLPIRRARVKVFLPSEISPENVRFLGYQGPYGSSLPFQLLWENGEIHGETTDLRPGEGLTVVVRAPSAHIFLPGAGLRLLWFLEDNLYAAIPLFVLLSMTLVWWKWGRDPRIDTVAPEFTPPEGIGPAEAGVLVDDRFDPRDFTAGLMSLATKGWLRIREEKNDFRLIPQKGQRKLTPYEEALRAALLIKDGDEGPRFADLKHRLYEQIPALRAKLFMELVDRGFYRADPENLRLHWRALSVGIVVLGFVLLSLLANVYLGLAVIISGIIVAVFAPYMPRKTDRGIKALRLVRGLAEYIRRAEIDRIEFAAREKHFEELLPYAVALGLSDLWVEKFASVLSAPPRWYEERGPWDPTVFTARILLLHQLSHAAATSRPRTASTSPLRGFGGRGFSGGGMGGGGGRTW